MTSRPPWHQALIWGLFLLSTLSYFQSPVRQYGDSDYCLLLSESLLSHRHFALDAYFSGRQLPYQIKRVRGHLYYVFPPGSSILSVPAVVIGRWFGDRPVDSDGVYDAHGDRYLQRRLAAVLCALIVVVLYKASRHCLHVGASLLIAIGAGFGTSLWSTASRALWSHAWLVLVLSLAVLELVRAESTAEKRALRAVWLGSLLGIAFWIRPTAAVPILVVSIWMIVRHRDRALRYLAPLATSGLLFLVHSEWLYRRILPPYYAPKRAASRHLLEALAGNLISPSRGLLVFTPVVLFLAWALIRYRESVRRPGLVVLAVSIIGLHWLVVSTFPQWWAGQCYGPRLMTDVVPWLALLAILALDARARAPVIRRGNRRMEVVIATLLLAASCGMHAAGALSRASNRWNIEPANVDQVPSRVWNWRQPQFMAWLQLPPVNSAARQSDSD